MKEMNPLEIQLRSWTPRPPSRRIERQLFGAPRQTNFTLPRLVSVLVPTAACLLLTLAGWKQFEQAGLDPGNPHAALVAMSLSNQSYAPYLAGNRQTAANRWDTFEWTNRGYSQSSMRPFTPLKAIDLQ